MAMRTRNGGLTVGLTIQVANILVLIGSAVAIVRFAAVNAERTAQQGIAQAQMIATVASLTTTVASLTTAVAVVTQRVTELEKRTPQR